MEIVKPKMKVRLAQIAPRLGDVGRNRQTHLEAVRQARADGLDLLVFPELSLTGYYLRDLTAEVAITADDVALREIAEAAGPMRTVVGFVERDAEARLFCSAAFMAEGAVRHIHRKVYLPTYGMFDEGRYLTPGEEVRAFDGGGFRGGMLICEDAWHLSLPLLLTRQWVDLMFIISSSPARGLANDRMAPQAAWEDMLATYARHAQAFVIYCNRAGFEDGVAFWGGSGVWAPSGQAVCRAPLLEEAMCECEIDLRDIAEGRMASPIVADERDDITLRELERILRGRA